MRNFHCNHKEGHEDINHLFVLVRLHAYATKYLAVICRNTEGGLSYRLSSLHFAPLTSVQLNIPRYMYINAYQEKQTPDV